MTSIVHRRPRPVRREVDHQPAGRERVSDVELGVAAILVGLVVLLTTVLVPIVG